MIFKPTLIHAAVGSVLVLGSWGVGGAQAATPTLNLFPTSVVENLQSSAASAQAMENNMEGIVAKLDNQMALYADSKCEANDADAGCSQIKRGIADSYQAMLEHMAEQLPAMKQAMQATEQTLGKRLRTELGKKMTALDLQRLIQGKKGTPQSIRQRSGKRQGRMSSMLGKYHKMITLSAHKNQNQALLAAEIYADASETLDYINLIQTEIDHSRVIGGLSTLWNGEPSEQMISTVSNVKALLFGDVEAGDEIPDVPSIAETQGFDDSGWVID